MTIKKRTGNEIPRPLIGKTHKYNRLVRFVDLNDYADRIIKFLKGGAVKLSDSIYDVSDNDSVIYTTEDTTINLQSASEGKRITIKNGEGGTTTIQAANGDTVEGQESIILTQPNASVQLFAIDDNKWIII